MKTKTLIFAMEVPDYWDTNDIYGKPVDKEGNVVLPKHNQDRVYDHESGVDAMLNETLVFAEKRYNKRIDGEGVATGFVLSEDFDINKLKSMVKHLEKNGGNLYV